MFDQNKQKSVGTSVLISCSPHIPYSGTFPSLWKLILPNPLCQYTLSGSSPFGCRSRSAFCTSPCSSCTALCDSEKKREGKTSQLTCRWKLTKGRADKKCWPVDASRSRWGFGWARPWSTGCQWRDCGDLLWGILHKQKYPIDFENTEGDDIIEWA